MRSVIMAGGRSTRLGDDIEKSLLRLCGMTLLERAVGSMRNSSAEEPIVAVSKWTPNTAKHAMDLGLEIINTPGKNYHDDTLILIDELDEFISLNVDVPFVGSNHIDYLLSNRRSGESMACMLPVELARSEIFTQSVFSAEDGSRYIWIGLNFVTASEVTDYLPMDDPLLAININTLSDLRIAEDLLVRKGGR